MGTEVYLARDRDVVRLAVRLAVDRAAALRGAPARLERLAFGAGDIRF